MGPEYGGAGVADASVRVGTGADERGDCSPEAGACTGDRYPATF